MNFLMVEGTSTEDIPLKIPKEVWILVDHLFTKSCDQVRKLYVDMVVRITDVVIVIMLSRS